MTGLPGPDHAVPDLLRRAREHMRAERAAQAEALAEVALAWAPACDEAMEILGRVAAQRGEHGRAVAFLSAAVARQESPLRQVELARALVALGRLPEALPAFRRAAALAPDDGMLANDLGVALAQTGAVAEAEAAFRRAVALLPEMAEARGNLATALHEQGRTAEAAVLMQPAAAADPAAVQDARAEALLQQRRFADAADASTAAVALRPHDPVLRARHADRLELAGRPQEAEAEARQALAMAPDLPAAHASLGWILRRQERLAEAIDVLSPAVKRWPENGRLANALAVAVLNTGQPEAALALLEQALERDPQDAEVQHNRATVLLRLGRFQQGWAAYDWRWRTLQGQAVARRFTQPLWTGEPLGGRTILLHAEQGLGDTLQFLRFVPVVAARGGRVILKVPAPVLRLAAGLPGVTALVCAGDELPLFDLHCPLMSLPRALGTLPDTIPPPPYLAADPGHVVVWRDRLAGAPGLRAGLIWAGNPEHRDDHRRSIPFAALAPLWTLPGVRWCSLQVGPRAADLTAAPPGVVTDLAPLLGDFGDTAAALSALDLLVCVDTAAVHLAGALGRPAWLLLAHAADWRWMTAPDSTVWYPSLRLFRQPRSGDWDAVVARVAAALAAGVA